ncbi:hypothetical protein BDU57DRAFT_517949 [Ampelomyces quisqualis]|uniref:Uncharacterized protein n=1 Tax=Ampelomyces quisqualis TaxID=50730 RepID=A0A6A5QHY4_AMPQU|nr:hypothetical protein BDU57DRAFT_517949 [Ampelomyces quisqualis]
MHAKNSAPLWPTTRRNGARYGGRRQSDTHAEELNAGGGIRRSLRDMAPSAPSAEDSGYWALGTYCDMLSTGDMLRTVRACKTTALLSPPGRRCLAGCSALEALPNNAGTGPRVLNTARFHNTGRRILLFATLAAFIVAAVLCPPASIS